MQLAPKDQDDFRVLVVDDDPTILSLVQEVVRMVPGCSVLGAPNPQEAMKYLVRGHIDIVITDVHMPGVNGVDMIRDIIALEQSPEIIVMTGFPSSELAEQVMELGAGSLLSKPLNDVRELEAELEKAIRRLVRKRATEDEVRQKKEELSQSQKYTDKDEAMKVSLDAELRADPKDLPEAKGELAKNLQVRAQGVAELQKPRKLYPKSMFEPLLEIEVARSLRTKRQFAVAFIDLPDSFGMMSPEDAEAFRAAQLQDISRCLRTSDVVVDLERDGMAVLAFECNKPGAGVVELKLQAAGFPFVGFSVFPNDGETSEALLKKAQENLQNKRKFQIVVFEEDEFHGRMICNMLNDQRYHVTWLRGIDETYHHVNKTTESLKLFVLSLTKDPARWRLLMRLVQERLLQWPVLLFTEVKLNRDLKLKLRNLGVKVILQRGIGQDEFHYIVQSLVMPKAQIERKNFRALVAIPVQYQIDGKSTSTNTFTLSRDGLFIRDMNPQASGSVIDLELFIPTAKKVLRTKADVLYSVPYFVGVNRFHVAGMAVKFKDMTLEDRDLIDAFVNDCLNAYLV